MRVVDVKRARFQAAATGDRQDVSRPRVPKSSRAKAQAQFMTLELGDGGQLYLGGSQVHQLLFYRLQVRGFIWRRSTR